MAENDYFIREYELVPPSCRRTPYEMWGFLELLEHEHTKEYDENRYYFPLVIDNRMMMTYVMKSCQYIAPYKVDKVTIGFNLSNDYIEWYLKSRWEK